MFETRLVKFANFQPENIVLCTNGLIVYSCTKVGSLKMREQIGNFSNCKLSHENQKLSSSQEMLSGAFCFCLQLSLSLSLFPRQTFNFNVSLHLFLLLFIYSFSLQQSLYRDFLIISRVVASLKICQVGSITQLLLILTNI